MRYADSTHDRSGFAAPGRSARAADPPLVGEWMARNGAPAAAGPGYGNCLHRRVCRALPAGEQLYPPAARPEPAEQSYPGERELLRRDLGRCLCADVYRLSPLSFAGVAV